MPRQSQAKEKKEKYIHRWLKAHPQVRFYLKKEEYDFLKALADQKKISVKELVIEAIKNMQEMYKKGYIDGYKKGHNDGYEKAFEDLAKRGERILAPEQIEELKRTHFSLGYKTAYIHAHGFILEYCNPPHKKLEKFKKYMEQKAKEHNVTLPF